MLEIKTKISNKKDIVPKSKKKKWNYMANSKPATIFILVQKFISFIFYFIG